MIERVKNRVFKILEIAEENDRVSKIFDIFIMALILFNVIAVVLETVESLVSRFGGFFLTFEFFSVAIFSVEYILRLWTCTEDRRFENPVVGRVRFALTPMAVVDLMAVLPFYLPVIFPLDPRFLRGLRLFRLFRLFKMGRYSESLQTLGFVLKSKTEEFVVTFFTISLLLVFASSLMYYVEHEAQPETFSSIPAAMWWGVATLTTVGYGDVYPITPLGKFLGAVIALLGIGMVALPAGIIASGFAEEMQRKKGKRRICPYCGKDIDEL